MAIYHIAYHAYKRAPSEKETRDRLAMLNAAFAAAPYVEDGFVGRYLGNPPDGYHDAACVKFKDIEAYRTHMRSPHGPDEATFLRENVVRIAAFDITTSDEPSDTEAKIIELYKERWELFPDVAPPRAAWRSPMSSYNPLLPQDRTAWLLAIGQKLRVEYDDIAEPMPPHLTALLKLRPANNPPAPLALLTIRRVMGNLLVGLTLTRWP